MRRGQRVWKAGNVSGNRVSNNAMVRCGQGDHEFSPRFRDVAAADLSQKSRVVALTPSSRFRPV